MSLRDSIVWFCLGVSVFNPTHRVCLLGCHHHLSLLISEKKTQLTGIEGWRIPPFRQLMGNILYILAQEGWRGVMHLLKGQFA